MVSKVRVGFRGWFLYISALKGWKLAGKAHPNIKTVTLFQSEQDTTEVSVMQWQQDRSMKQETTA